MRFTLMLAFLILLTSGMLWFFGGAIKDNIDRKFRMSAQLTNEEKFIQERLTQIVDASLEEWQRVQTNRGFHQGFELDEVILFKVKFTNLDRAMGKLGGKCALETYDRSYAICRQKIIEGGDWLQDYGKQVNIWFEVRDPQSIKSPSEVGHN